MPCFGSLALHGVNPSKKSVMCEAVEIGINMTIYIWLI